jgi:plasmid stabilization system protein ParE
MRYDLVITKEANKDTLETFRWYEDKAFGLGKRFEIALDDAYDLLEDTPNSFQLKEEPFRKVHLKTFPYSVIYEIDEANKLVIIFAVLAQKNNPDKLQKRIEK